MTRKKASTRFVDDLLRQDYPIPDAELHTLPAFIEVQPGEFVAVDAATKDQLFAASDLHNEIAWRHYLTGEKLRNYAVDRN
jgi:hypothetical protein